MIDLPGTALTPDWIGRQAPRCRSVAAGCRLRNGTGRRTPT